MVSAALAESPELRVVDSLRVLRTLEDLKLAAGPLPDAELKLLAEVLDVDRLVLGSLRASAEALRVEGQVVETDQPDLPRQRLVAQAATGDGVFALIEDFGRQLRQNLEVPAAEGSNGTAAGTAAGQPRAAPPAEALEAYATGLESSRRGDDLQAEPALRKAVEAYPEFSAAWVRLAEVSERLGHSDQAQEAARRAVELTGGATADTAGGSRLAYEARARLAVLQGDPQKARQILSELVERYPYEMEARVSLAEACADGGDFETASRLLTEVVERDPNHPRAWFLLGKFAILRGRSRQAIDQYLVHALVVQNRLRNAQGKADVLNAMGAAAQQLGALQEAEERYREAAQLRRSIGDQRGYSASLNNLAAIQTLEGNFDGAQASLAEAMAIREEIGDRPGIARVLNQMGLLAEQQGRYQDALTSFRRTLEMRRQLGDQRDLAESHSNVAFTYYMLGEYDNATVYWQQALDLYRAGDNRRGVVQTTQSIAQLALARGHWDAASRSFLEALEMSRELSMRAEEAVSRGYLGRLAQLQGRYGAALASYGEALELLRGLEDSRGIAEFGLFEASCLLEIGATAAAREKLETLTGILAQGGNRDQQAELRRLEAELALAEGDLGRARNRAADAVAQAQASGNVSATLRARLTLGAVSLAAGDSKAAQEELEKIFAATNELGDVNLQLAAGDALARARLERGKSADAETAARDGVRLARSRAPVGQLFRYYLTLARVLEGRGAAAEAQEQRRLAAQEVARLLENLPSPWRAGFEQRPEVQALAAETTPFS
jgi:tetratricopeptide (TPR) repeat protein